MKNSVKQLLEFKARDHRYRFGCITLDLMIQIAQNLHDQDLKLSVTGWAQVRKFSKVQLIWAPRPDKNDGTIESEFEDVPQEGVQEDELSEKVEKLNSLLSPVTSNKLLNTIFVRVLSTYNGFQFTYNRTSLWSISIQKNSIINCILKGEN